MKTLKVIGNCCLVFLAVIGICVSLAYGYYHFFVDDITIGVNNIDNQVGFDVEEIVKEDDLSDEEVNAYKDRYFLEANYYSNSKENGIELQELKLNYFTSYELTTADYRSTGMQYIGDYQGLPLDTWDGNTELTFYSGNDRYYGTSEQSVSIANNYVDTSFTYYDSTNGINWSGVTNNNGSIATELKRSTNFIIKIDDRAFSIALDKYFDKDIGDVRNIFGIGWKVGEKYNRYYYTYGSLFQSCMNAIKTNSAGYGDYYITVDLSSLFSIREYDVETGKFKTDDVTDIIKTYSVLKFHYDENGAKSSTQSFFGSINGDSSYNVDDPVDTTYWQERVVYTLNENDYSYRYSDTYKGYFLSLNMELKQLFADMPRTKVFVNIDLQSDYLKDNNINVVGLDYNAFENFEIDTLTITGNSQTLYLLDKALYDTQLQTLKYSNGITLDFAENAINNEYVEVVL